ncbi:hypothetical protein KY495_16650 [Massilia sp. PAMC28688]|uniref:hypothetical protein n=1 Tax=Massilia sp. PAMC28688 TaxID=2861283 RepID=UPI001C62D3C0|nr:hypothetical protein [Massilia sp. PAMC28688]QYF92373.1 hypothetical protein KY495_16650 [Massilia sp. PAMC28688]
MAFPLAPTDRHQRHSAIALMLGMHAVLLGALFFSRPQPEQIAEGRRMVFMFVQEKPAPAPPSAIAQPAAPRAPARAVKPAPLTPRPPAPGKGESIPPAPAALTPSLEAPGAGEMLERARADIGAIERDMRGQIPKGLVRAPVMTAHKRFVKGVEEAAELAPPRWYEAPKIKEIIDPGGWGNRRYRVITANRTYCLTYAPNRHMGGNDVFKRSATTIPTTCDPDEQAPTVQP